MGLGRVELPTSPLSGVRSNQLSYRPVLEAGGAGRDRTGDLLNANQALSQLSYSPVIEEVIEEEVIEADWTQPTMTSTADLKRVKLFEWRYRRRYMDWKGCHLLQIRRNEPNFQ